MPAEQGQMTPREYGRQLARRLPPPSDEQIEKAARILVTVKPGEEVTGETKSVDGDGT